MSGRERIVLLPGEGRSIDVGGFTMCVKASEAETAGSFTLLQADEPPGFGPPLHIHHAMVGYFDDLSAALAAGEADPGELGVIAERYSMEVIGPVPDGYL
ncbi:MAG: hypothetical protein WAK18_17770 [Nocardioidaceae bacterium]